MTYYRVNKSFVLLMLALAAGSCATLQPPSATGPRGNEPPYPVIFKEDIHRKDLAVAAVNKLSPLFGVSPTDLELQPITSTIEGLHPSGSSPLYLPKVGAEPVMNEEEIRESLRRFIKDWQELIGADPAKLSLVDRLDQPDGSKLAKYEQRPFRYPIRGKYGKLQIRFTTDRRVLNISSTCIPDADRMQTAIGAVSAKLNPEDAIKQLHDNAITYSDAKGNKLSFRAPATNEGHPAVLAIYILPSKSGADALDFHLTWEIELNNAPVKQAYVDAVNGEILGG
ncbi:MAG: hypothetical protein M3Y84_11660, partial [Acidobacteriota bacterium]|nr:hypothetical protein [Acidobacteriota bacterium]